MHLTFAEEFLLLALDDRGRFVEIPPMALEYGLAGALLMELSLGNHIDSDLKKLYIVNPSPTGDALLDDTLRQLHGEEQTIKYWVKELPNRLPELRERVVNRLVSHGILKKEEHKVLWVFSSRRYPCIDNHEEEEVLRRIRRTVLEDDIPDPRDIVLISLVFACDLVEEIFAERERAKAYDRIAEISKMDLIGQAVNTAVQELNRLVASAVSSVSTIANPVRV